MEKETNDAYVERKDRRAEERKQERSHKYVERKQDPKPSCVHNRPALGCFFVLTFLERGGRVGGGGRVGV